MIDSAIADYDSVLRLDPALADIHNRAANSGARRATGPRR